MFKIIRNALLFSLGGFLASSPAFGQASVTPWIINGNGATANCPVGNGTNSCPMPVNATVSATVAVAPLTSIPLSSTITTTGTFQSIQISTAGRNGCTIENQSTTDPMWVFFGPIVGATKGKSFEIGGGSFPPAISCAVGGLGVLTDQVSITGTSTDAFTANFQ